MFGAINKILKGFLGDKSQKDIKEVMPYVEQTNEIYAQLTSLSNDELRGCTEQLKKRIQESIASQKSEIQELEIQAQTNDDIDTQEAIYEKIDSLTSDMDKKVEEVLLQILPEAFAIVKETSRRFSEMAPLQVTATPMDKDIAAQRPSVQIEGDQAIWQNKWDAAGAEITWNMVHYDVQLIGGSALHLGKVAEMQTGEGKTLVATLPVFLNALTGMGVHLVTVNDYLARRDSEWMGPLFEFHGLSVDCIDKHQPNSEERRSAYKKDIIYGTNNEFGFDYLRDNMASDVDMLVQRKHHYAIIDEVDSVLIDEARTPLIISGPTPKGDEQEYDELKPKVQQLLSAQKQATNKFLSEAKQRLAKDSPSKEDVSEGGLALFRAHRGLPKNKALIKFLSEEGMKQTLLKTEGYYLQDNQREMWKADEELYFAIDEKNNQIELTEKGIDLISKNMDDDSFFALPDIGTEIAEIENSSLLDKEKVKKKQHLIEDYSIKSARVHTINQLLKAYALFEKDVDYVLMENKVKIVDEQTGRIMDGRRYSDGLHQAIEAKESVKVEAATQTYATVTLQNYFRMYHKLAGMTGTAETEAGELWDIYKLDVMVIPTNRPIQRQDKEDLVYRSKREKYNAVIDEVVRLSEAGRPTLVGTTTVEVSELLSKMLNIRKIKHQVLNAKMHQREAEIVAKAGQQGTVTIATNMAGRGTDIKLTDEVKSLGGLAIIGTERHDSRRVDRQLRGRSGRQGDPGSSQFYVSMEDDLMRLFGSDRMAKMMDRLGIEEGEVIQHSMITKSIERAQSKVEENNFGIRKRLLEYDDVMNAQREVIYKRRRHALFGERMQLDIANMFYGLAETVVAQHQASKDYQGFKLESIRVFGVEPSISQDDFLNQSPDVLSGHLYLDADQNYKGKLGKLVERVNPVIDRVYHDETNTYKNMAIPFTDGRKAMHITANIEKSFESEGKEVIDALERNVTLAFIDDQWKNHLRDMDDLRSNVQHARFEQKDPLLIYKFESFQLFEGMVNQVNQKIASFLLRCNLPENPEAKKAPQPKRQQLARTLAQKSGVQNLNETVMAQQRQAVQSSGRQAVQKTAPIKSEKTVGRNDPCPCGSGKKFKQCHGK